MQKRQKRGGRRQKGLDRRSKKKPSTATERADHEETHDPLDSALAEDDWPSSIDDSLSLPSELLNLSEKPKRGRRTTGDNFLVGDRNNWLYFFERFWHEIGWSLLQVRERGSSNIDEIRLATTERR